jgi:predicted Na+-dependent transporter
VQAGIEFFCPSEYGIDVYFAREAIVVGGFLDILLHFIMLKLPFQLVSHPLEAIFLQVDLHLLYFLLQLCVLPLHLLHLLVLLSSVVSVVLQKDVLGLDLL